jgi:hypothetical protein
MKLIHAMSSGYVDQLLNLGTVGLGIPAEQWLGVGWRAE